MYKLIKMSSDGFEMYSESLGEILGVLEGYICPSCMAHDVSEDYVDLPTSTQIEELLWCPCGAEFIFCEDAREPIEDPYNRQWWCQEKMGGYLVCLKVGDREVNEFIDRTHWNHCTCKPELIRCVIQRL